MATQMDLSVKAVWFLELTGWALEHIMVTDQEAPTEARVERRRRRRGGRGREREKSPQKHII